MMTNPDLARLIAKIKPILPTADGQQRSAEAERQIDGAFRVAFGTEPGKLVLEHLIEITCAVALPPAATDAELRHLEGMRALVGIIRARASSRPEI